jgi:hypothetical protein
MSGTEVWQRADEAPFGCGDPKTGIRKLLSGPIKSESAKLLIFRLAPKNRESENQRIVSRFKPETKNRESVLRMRSILGSDYRGTI